VALQIKKVKNKHRKRIVVNTYIGNGNLKRWEREKENRMERAAKRTSEFVSE